jgi:2-octaprenyl-6-methoxyphenol hydroxylase
MRVDVVVAGAGPVGCTLGLALAAAGRKVVILDARSRAALASTAFRPIALSYASRLILERIDAWEGLPASVIDSIHVSQAGGFGRTLMTAPEAGLPELGRVVEHAILLGVLLDRCVQRIAECRFEESILRTSPEAGGLAVELAGGERLLTACLVHAEGTSDAMHEKRYAQDALVAAISADPPAAGRAFERFTPQGPLALLPLAGRYAMVWAAHPERTAALASLVDDEFLSALQAAFGRRAGRFIAAGARSISPLALRRRRLRVEGRQVYIGNAAQALHPVAGQGLNLGLRDAWAFARAVGDFDDAGHDGVLARYAALRKYDAFATVGVTDLLATRFAQDAGPGTLASGLAMLALDACAPARRFFARRMVFGPSAIP